MSLKKLTVVIDETGVFQSTSNGFGVGAILFPEDKRNLLIKAAKEIAKLTGKDDLSTSMCREIREQGRNLSRHSRQMVCRSTAFTPQNLE